MSERLILLSKEATYNRCTAALELKDESHCCQLEPDHEGDHTNGLRTWGNLFATWYEIVRV